MIDRIIVEHPETKNRYDCHLGGFGSVRCGACREPFRSTALGSKCPKCGCKIVETHRLGGRKFEGTYRVKE